MQEDIEKSKEPKWQSGPFGTKLPVVEKLKKVEEQFRQNRFNSAYVDDEKMSLQQAMFLPRSDPRRQAAMSWTLQNIDKIQWVGGRKCSLCRDPGHDKRSCHLNTSKSLRKCSRCEETGHTKRTCPQPIVNELCGSC